MENPCRIICFGDSITGGYFPYFEKRFGTWSHTRGYTIRMSNRGVNGETAEDGLRRLRGIIADGPQVVVVGFGMNDFLQGVPVEHFARHLAALVDPLCRAGIRVILNTLNPVCISDGRRSDPGLAPYNTVIYEMARRWALVVNDVGQYWQQRLSRIQEALVYDQCDWIHPNHIGYRLVAERLTQLVPRSMTRIVWQFNGANAACNYSCPYCYKPAAYHEGDHFRHTIQRWRKAFKKTFHHRRLNFYLSFGEPTMAGRFEDVIDMIEAEPRWKVVVLTNLSRDPEPLFKRPIARQGRLFMVASFHPSMTAQGHFIERILVARRHGVEIPVVYVMWPPQIKGFVNDYFPAFQRHRILVHVRRFRGRHLQAHFPPAYAWEQIKIMGRYMDDNTIKYMLCDRLSSGRESFAGMSYLGVSNNGDMWVCPDWAGEALGMGNVTDGTGAPLSGPQVLGGTFSDGTTDGLANLLETGMDELDDNHILSYSRQNGFDMDSAAIGYPNWSTDFDSPSERVRLGLEGLYEQIHRPVEAV